nr:glycosyltransferase family 4 protein [Saprospiraceae bacterium]
MRVAVIADPLDNQNAGVHVYTREMIRSMIASNPGHELILIREKKDPKIKGVRQIGVWNTRLPIGFASLRLFILIPLILRWHRVDAVIEPAHFGPFNLPASVKRITVIHDLTPVLFPGLHRWHSQLLQRLFLKGIMRNADLIVANSEHTKRDICNYAPEVCEKVVRIYPSTAEGPVKFSEAVLKQYGIRPPYFLTVGTVEPRKNHAWILDAFEEFKSREMSNCQLVISGGRGWKSNSFFEKMENHPFRKDIVYTGFVPDEHLPSIYHFSIAMLYPSQYEGFGLPVLEAIRWGTIPVVRKNSSLPEVAGPSAFYIRGEDAIEFGKLLGELSSLNKEERLKILRPLREFTEKFSWDNFGMELWNQLESISAK